MPQNLPSIDLISSRRGSYGLLISVSQNLLLRRPRFRGAILKRGEYLYAGSAFGPGGIRGRVRYHLSSKKSSHWHVDELTKTGLVKIVFVFPGTKECQIIEEFCNITEVQTPVPGFGSSDCATCKAHLIQVPIFRIERFLPKGLRTASIWMNEKVL